MAVFKHYSSIGTVGGSSTYSFKHYSSSVNMDVIPEGAYLMDGPNFGATDETVAISFPFYCMGSPNSGLGIQCNKLYYTSNGSDLTQLIYYYNDEAIGGYNVDGSSKTWQWVSGECGRSAEGITYEEYPDMARMCVIFLDTAAEIEAATATWLKKYLVYGDCLTIEATSSMTLVMENPSMTGTLQYSFDHDTWVDYTSGEAIEIDDKYCYLRGSENMTENAFAAANWEFSDKVRMWGNLDTLLDYQCTAEWYTLPAYCYADMFQSNQQIIRGPDIMAPVGSYFSCAYMYEQAGVVYSGPIATIEVEQGSCFERMFLESTIISAPYLHVKSFSGNSTYDHMLSNCANLQITSTVYDDSIWSEDRSKVILICLTDEKLEQCAGIFNGSGSGDHDTPAIDTVYYYQ